jgi:hypothetical protein
MLIDQKQVNAHSPDFVKNRVAMQNRYLLEFWEKFDGMAGSTLIFIVSNSG